MAGVGMQQLTQNLKGPFLKDFLITQELLQEWALQWSLLTLLAGNPELDGVRFEYWLSMINKNPVPENKSRHSWFFRSLASLCIKGKPHCERRVSLLMIKDERVQKASKL